MPDNRFHVDGARVLADLNTLRGIGAYKTGVHKPTFSEPHMRSLEWLAQRLPEAGVGPPHHGHGHLIGAKKKNAPKKFVGAPLPNQKFSGLLEGPPCAAFVPPTDPPF